MWCRNCNIETNDTICPVCSETTVEDIPIEIHWCVHCKTPIIQNVTQADKGICPLCGEIIKYLSADLRPVFPEERLLLELLLDKEPNEFIKKSVWAANSRYYIDEKSIAISSKTFQFADTNSLINKIGQYKKIIVINIKKEKNIMQYNNTLSYYNSYADEFYKSTVNIDFTTMQEHFLTKLKKGSNILDFGCGSGRDTKYFLEQGYNVEAIDGSAELCKLASEYTGIKVRNIFFQNLSEVDKYDGIWACSSILHLPVRELLEVMRKMMIALKKNGVIYTSFKYGIFEGERNGRYFTDMTEETFAEFLSRIDGLEKEDQWITSDVRPGRGEEKWLNLILRKG